MPQHIIGLALLESNVWAGLSYQITICPGQSMEILRQPLTSATYPKRLDKNEALP
jgi:hypothetical protein